MDNVKFFFDKHLIVANLLFLLCLTNITLNAGNDINIFTVQDYEYERQYSKTKSGGLISTKTTKEDITQSLTNIKSNITANNNLSITTGNDLTSIGTNFTAGTTASNHSPLEGESNEQGLDRSSFGEGSITFDIGNDLNLYNAMDYNYEYHYLKKEKFDFASAIANVGAAVAVGALTGGAGAAAMAGAASSMGASQMTKGSVDIKMNYDETTIGNNLKGNNINISTGNNATLISANIDATNNINLDIGNELLIGSAEEKHQSFSKHETWGGDIGMAALGGAMTGLVSGLGMQGGMLLGSPVLGVGMSGLASFGSSNVANVLAENRKGESKGTYTTNQIGSDLTAINDINITTNNNLNIVGSDLLSGNNTILTSNNGSVNILAAIETITTEESKTKTGFNGIDFTHTNSSVGIEASVERKTSTTTTTTQTARSSNIQSANNIIINSGNNNNSNNRQDINIMGSNIVAENDIKLNSKKGNINVISQELLQDVLDRQKTETITASVGITNYWVKAGDQANNIIKNSKGGARDNGTGYANTFFDLGNIGMSVMNAVNSPLGFGVSADISYTNTETTTSQNNTYNQRSAIISNKDNIDMTAENNINIKGSTIATNGENKEINLTSNNGDINITASKDTTNIGSNTHSNSVDIDLSLIPTYSYNDSETTIEQTRYNNSIITANGNNSKINIESKNKDINIKGANIEADDDINLLAQNGNMNIESNQDRNYSNTDNWGMQLGGSVGFNVGKDYQEDITNNYTTIISHKKDENGNNINGVNIDTNNLTLVGINQETRDNLNLDLVRGTITETKLQEKHNSEYYDFGITYSLPVSIGDLNQKVNNLLADGINAVANKLSNMNNKFISKVGNTISNSKGIQNNISKPDSNNGNTLPPKTDSQSIINSGNWKDSWKNTTISYKDDNGWDFVASPASAYQSVVITGTALKYGMLGTEEIAEFGRETLEKILGGVGFVASQPFSAVEGFFDYFVENDSKAYVYDEKNGYKETNSIKEGKNYYTNGIMNRVEDDISDYLSKNQDSVVRYNPTSGFTGDLMESTLGKLLNWNGLTAQLGSMNRIIANDLTERKDMQYSNNNFHSQGTINGVGAMNILARNDIKLNDTQSLNAKGPAVYNKTWDNTASQILDRKTYVAANDGGLGKKGDVLYSNITYSHNEKDPVRYLTAPRTPWDPFLGLLYGITNMKEHNIGSYK